ncbi:hypothetical protein E5287_03015 [Mycoplasmopsis agalactiae]|uniref:lipoprotein, MAG6090 family n=1 Tax=Mycoplasmopsis agalactiae TaxID=2110 RepID=UPI00031E8163|nr:hypothetical protein [Mycoplasmopsis agalactiae]QYR08764.1 hypothetical protein E5287_03015 [Mycoplasmopsis agalactiae]
MSNPKKVGGGQYNFYRLLIIIECRIYEKTLLAKNVLLLISMPLISSACYAPNILENNANKPCLKGFFKQKS